MLSPHRGLAPRVSIIPNLKKPSRERVCLRLWCTMVLFIYASRSGLPSKEAYDTAMELRPLYDGLIAQEDKHFAEEDIGAASRAYCGGILGEREEHEPVLEFRESFYICIVLSTLSHIKHRQHGQNKIKINQVITWSRSRNSNSPCYWHGFRIGSWCIRRGTN